MEDIKREIRLIVYRKLWDMGYHQKGNDETNYEQAKKHFPPEVHKYVADYLGV